MLYLVDASNNNMLTNSFQIMGYADDIDKEFETVQ